MQVQLIRLCFNPTRVRLKRGVVTVTARLSVGFNPTRVRLKRGPNIDQLAPVAASTPQGFV